MALKNTWKNKVDGVDDVLAEDINRIAKAVIDIEEVDTGIKNRNNAEIFNDYENNETNIPYAHIEGRYNKSIIKCFLIQSYNSNTVTLDSVEGIEVGMNWNIFIPHADELYDKYRGKVESIDGNVVTLSNDINVVSLTGIEPATTGSFLNTFIVHGGMIGTTLIEDDFNAFSTHLSGEETIGYINSHTEGRWTKALGYATHAEGYKTEALGERSHAEGYKAIAFGNESHAEGLQTESIGQNSHAEGRNTKAIGLNAHSEGCSTEAHGISSHAEGLGAITGSEGEAAHAEGYKTEATALAAHAEGNNTDATAEAAHAEGLSAIASALAAHAEGQHTDALGVSSHAEGNRTKTEGANSHAEGFKSQALADNSHAEGRECFTRNDNAHAEGMFSEASGYASHAEGRGTKASGTYQHVQGRYNVEDPSKAHIVGGGTSDTDRKNIHTLDWDGNAYYAGSGEFSSIILRSSTPESKKKFKLTVDDVGEITVAEI